MYITTHLVFKLKFSRSQDKWECDLNLTYPPFKLNGLRTTGPRFIQPQQFYVNPSTVGNMPSYI